MESIMNTVKAILIDPVNQTIESVQLDVMDTVSALKQIYKHIGTDEIGHMGLRNGDSAWHDDNGMLRDWNQQHFFLAPFYPEPLAGKFLITRIERGGWNEKLMDRDEWMADCKTDIELVRQAIRWLSPEVVEVTAPMITTFNKDGTSTSETLDGGPDKWTYKDNPAKREQG
jgi:hypothetical protein